MTYYRDFNREATQIQDSYDILDLAQDIDDDINILENAVIKSLKDINKGLLWMEHEIMKYSKEEEANPDIIRQLRQSSIRVKRLINTEKDYTRLIDEIRGEAKNMQNLAANI